MCATFNRFDIQLTKAQALAASYSGDCTADVLALSQVPKVRHQLDRLDPDALRAELREYGAWSEEDLAEDEPNRQRILWIAAGDILENPHSPTRRAA